MELIDSLGDEVSGTKHSSLREKAVGEDNSGTDENTINHEQVEEEQKEEESIREEEGMAEEEENDDKESLIVDSSKELTDQERAQLYEKAMKFKMKKSYKHALLCFLGCIKGIQQSTTFAMLPSCLQNIASIYAKFEDFPKAVQFMQAAKLYYETALIGSQGGEDYDYKTMDESATEGDAMKANEYEKLSHECLIKKNIQLALEYCGKATQLRRKVYGEDHPVTIKSLDLFTMIYAEMGKLQYSDAVKKLEEPVSSSEQLKPILKKVRFEDEELNDKEKELQGSDDSSQAKDKAVGEDELSESNFNEMESTTQREISFTSKQMLLVFLVSIIAAVLLTFVFCVYTEHPVCPSYSYFSERVKFNYYYYVKSFFSKHMYI